VQLTLDGVEVGSAPADQPRPDSGTADGFAFVVAAAPGDHQLCARATNVGLGSTDTDLGCRSAAPVAGPAGFVPITPRRVLDSRVPPSAPWGPGATKDLQLVGDDTGVPAAATAAVLNVTVTGGTADFDYVTVWPSGTPRPTVSSLNVNAGQTVANQVTVKLGAGADPGRISIFNAGGTLQVIVDVTGYYAPGTGDGFVSRSPVRVFDSRPPPQRVGPTGTWKGGDTKDITILGVLSGVPADADAVVLNVTVTGPAARGDYLTVWPAGQPRPPTSNLNLDAGQTVANAVTVGLGTGADAGQISVFNAWGDVDVIVDVAGYFEAGSGASFFAVDPVRIIDSRPLPARVGPLGGWTDNASQDVLAVGASSGVPLDATAVVFNLTATNATAGGDYLTVWPSGSTRPLASSLNFRRGQTAANAVTVGLGTHGTAFGRLSLFNAYGTVDSIVDIAGYYR
jgi:hypothetical protein